MPTISSVVATGRRMNVRDGLTWTAFLSPVPLHFRFARCCAACGPGRAFQVHRDFAAFLQFVDAGHDHLVACNDPGSYLRIVVVRGADLDLAHRHGGIRLDQIDVSARSCCAAWRRTAPAPRRVFPAAASAHSRTDWGKAHCEVVESGAQFHRARGLIDLVIDRGERAGCKLLLHFAVQSVHRQFLSGALFLQIAGN